MQQLEFPENLTRAALEESIRHLYAALEAFTRIDFDHQLPDDDKFVTPQSAMDDADIAMSDANEAIEFVDKIIKTGLGAMEGGSDE